MLFRAVWSSPRWNHVLQSFLPHVRLPFTLSGVSFADRWWLSNCFRSQLGAPLQVVSIFAEWRSRFAQLDQLEPLAVVFFYQIAENTASTLLTLASILYASGIGNLSLFSITWAQMLLLLLAVLIRNVIFQPLWIIYSCFHPQYAVHHLPLDPSFLVSAPLSSAAAATVPLAQNIEEERGEEGGEEREEEREEGNAAQRAQNRTIDLRLPNFAVQSAFHSPISAEQLLWKTKWPFLMLHYSVVSLLSLFTGRHILAARALYDLVPLFASSLALCWKGGSVASAAEEGEGGEGEGEGGGGGGEATEKMPVLIGNESGSRLAQSLRLLWLYAVPRVALAHILDRFLLLYVVGDENAAAVPLFVFLNALVEYFYCAREMAHRIK